MQRIVRLNLSPFLTQENSATTQALGKFALRWIGNGISRVLRSPLQKKRWTQLSGKNAPGGICLRVAFVSACFRDKDAAVLSRFFIDQDLRTQQACILNEGLPDSLAFQTGPNLLLFRLGIQPRADAHGINSVLGVTVLVIQPCRSVRLALPDFLVWWPNHR